MTSRPRHPSPDRKPGSRWRSAARRERFFWRNLWHDLFGGYSREEVALLGLFAVLVLCRALARFLL